MCIAIKVVSLLVIIFSLFLLLFITLKTIKNEQKLSQISSDLSRLELIGE